MPSDAGGLEAEHLVYEYGRTRVLDDVSLHLPVGTVMALAGPNGSGKTTLLRLLSGYLAPRAGTVTLDSTALSAYDARHRARQIAVVPQRIDPRLSFTALEMVTLGRTPHAGLLGSATRADRVAVENALEATDSQRLAHRRFNELSGGEQQRVALAVALAQEARYLLLDEPTVHLDLHHQHGLLELLRALHASRGLAILAVMHDINLAALYFDQIALIDRGRILARGPASDVLSRLDLQAVFRAPLTVVRHPTARVPQVLLERGMGAPPD